MRYSVNLTNQSTVATRRQEQNYDSEYGGWEYCLDAPLILPAGSSYFISTGEFEFCMPQVAWRN